MGDLKEPSQVGLFTARAPDAPRCKALVQSKHSTLNVQSDSISNIHLDKLGPYTGILKTN